MCLNERSGGEVECAELPPEEVKFFFLFSRFGSISYSGNKRYICICLTFAYMHTKSVKKYNTYGGTTASVINDKKNVIG